MGDFRSPNLQDLSMNQGRIDPFQFRTLKTQPPQAERNVFIGKQQQQQKKKSARARFFLRNPPGRDPPGAAVPAQGSRDPSPGARPGRGRGEAEGAEREMWPMNQNPNRTPSQHPNPTTRTGSNMGGEFTYQPKWDPIGFDPPPCLPKLGTSKLVEQSA